MMVQRKLHTEYDPMSGAKAEYWVDHEEGKFFTKVEHDMAELMKVAHQMRMNESSVKKFRSGDRAVSKHVGFIPMSLASLRPELAWDRKAMLRFLEHECPKLKTTNAKLC